MAICLLLVFVLLSCGCSQEAPANDAVENQATRAAAAPSGPLSYQTINLSKFSSDCDSSAGECASIKISYPQFDRAAINNIVLRKILASAASETPPGDLDEMMQQFIDEYAAHTSEYGPELYGWTSERSVMVITNKKGLLSLEFSGSSYTGGAHPNGFTDYLNIDLASAKAIKLSDIFTAAQRATLRKIAEAAFRREHNIAAGANLNDRGFSFDNNQFSLSENFAVLDDRLRFFYNSYEIAPYSMGPIQIELSYNELKSVLPADASNPLFPLLKDSGILP